jgi:hypothetical protein
MPRKVDTPGEVSDPASKTTDVGPPLAPFSIEIPLWRYGRIRFETSSQAASLALVTLVALLAIMVILGLIEALPGAHPGVQSIMDKLGQALTLVLGVLLGAVGKGKSGK